MILKKPGDWQAWWFLECYHAPILAHMKRVSWVHLLKSSLQWWKVTNIWPGFLGSPLTISLLVFTAGLLCACVCRFWIFHAACLQSDLCSHLATEADFPRVTNTFLVSKLREHIFTSRPLPPPVMTSLLGFPDAITLFLYRDPTFYLSSCWSFSSLFIVYSCFCLSGHSDPVLRILVCFLCMSTRVHPYPWIRYGYLWRQPRSLA